MSQAIARTRGLLRWILAATLSALLVSAPAFAQEFVWAPDYPVGASFPAIDAPDQNGERRTFDDLKGENGLLFMLSRSFDW